MFSIFKKNSNGIFAPVNGRMFPIEQVRDDVFSSKMMGDGVAFEISGDKVILASPADGTLSVMFPTGHAYGIHMKDGTDVLVHVGIDTVNAEGKGFKVLGKKQDDSVKKGDPLIEVDVKTLREKYDMSVMLIITDPAGHTYTFIDPCTVNAGDKIIK